MPHIPGHRAALPKLSTGLQGPQFGTQPITTQVQPLTGGALSLAPIARFGGGAGTGGGGGDGAEDVVEKPFNPPAGPGNGGDGTNFIDPKDAFDVDLGAGFPGFSPKDFTNLGQGFVGGEAPQFQQFGLGDSAARQQFQDIFERGTGGSIRSFNRAQNRLRERLERGEQVSRQGALDQALGGGRGAFQGAIQQRLGQIGAGRLGAEAEGLVGLERDFEQSRLQGLQAALGGAQGLSGLDVAFNQLGLQQSLAGNEFGRDIFQEQERLRQLEGGQQRETITDRTLALLDQITKRGGIRAGVLQSIGGGLFI